MRRALAAIGVTAALVMTGCTDDVSRQRPFRLVAALTQFDACDDFLGYVRDAARERVGAYGIGGYGGYGGGIVPMMEDVARSSDAAAETIGGAPAAPATTAADQKAATGSDGANAATNNQEADVDEADLVKVDGDRVVTVRGNEVVVATLTGGVPRITGRVRLSGGTADRLFLLADRAYLLGTADTAEPPVERAPAGDALMPVGAWTPKALLTEVSLAGDAPTVVGTRTIDGQILDGRMVEGTLRLVLSSTGGTRLGFVAPADGTQSAIDRAIATNRDVIDGSTAADWLPSVTGGRSDGPLLSCSDAYHPAEFAGFSMLSVLTVADGLDSLTATGVLADSQVTYASTERLYVATTRWVGQDDPTGTTQPEVGDAIEHTDVHAFDIAGTKAARYLASGRVDGQLLNQYSMSDADGRLRIATTVTTNRAAPTTVPELTCEEAGACAEPGATGSGSAGGSGGAAVEPGAAPTTVECPEGADCAVTSETAPSTTACPPDARCPAPTPASAEPVPMPTVTVEPMPVEPTPVEPKPTIVEPMPTTPTTDSRIVVLEQRGQELAAVGSIRGLGAGETIRSVRFVDDLAYVVTFRQTDPFYVVDLSDPTAPRKLGELKVPGFSSYLHPVGDHLVLGVGSDATAEGRITGAKVSLYDTTNPVAPREVATWTARDVSFMVDGDPKAFHWDAERGLAFIPFTGSCWDVCSSAVIDNGVLVLHVDSTGIREVGRIDHRDRTPGEPTPDTTTTTVPEVTTTTEAPPTTVAETTTVPSTSVPDTTTVPVTTVPAAGERDSSMSSDGSSSTVAAEPGVVEASPPVECGPAVDCVAPDYPPVDYLPTISRVFVVGDVVVTLSDAGIATHDVSTLAHRGFAAF